MEHRRRRRERLAILRLAQARQLERHAVRADHRSGRMRRPHGRSVGEAVVVALPVKRRLEHGVLGGRRPVAEALAQRAPPLQLGLVRRVVAVVVPGEFDRVVAVQRAARRAGRPAPEQVKHHVVIRDVAVRVVCAGSDAASLAPARPAAAGAPRRVVLLHPGAHQGAAPQGREPVAHHGVPERPRLPLRPTDTRVWSSVRLGRRGVGLAELHVTPRVSRRVARRGGRPRVTRAPRVRVLAAVLAAVAALRGGSPGGGRATPEVLGLVPARALFAAESVRRFEPLGRGISARGAPVRARARVGPACAAHGAGPPPGRARSVPAPPRSRSRRSRDVCDDTHRKYLQGGTR